MQVDLGIARATGRAGLDECQEFKDAIWRRLGRNHAGAFLKTTHDGEHCGIEADYDAGVPGAQEWALAALSLAPEAWKTARAMLDAEIRIVARRAM